MNKECVECGLRTVFGTRCTSCGADQEVSQLRDRVTALEKELSDLTQGSLHAFLAMKARAERVEIVLESVKVLCGVAYDVVKANSYLTMGGRMYQMPLYARLDEAQNSVAVGLSVIEKLKQKP